MSVLAIEMRGICKRFGAVQANADVTLRVAAGSVHGIVGENGAGKSTLMSILYGFYQADAGQIVVAGRPVSIGHARAAIALGIGMVHQHFMLVEPLSALDNILLGAEGHWHLPTARARVRQRLQQLMADTGLQVRLDQPVEQLPVGERQRLEILKALFRGARTLILDEPTAVLTPQETEALFATLRQLRAQGCTLLLISHKLKEIMALCDQVTVMRQGRVVLDCPTRQTSIDGLAQAMVGRQVQLGVQRPAQDDSAAAQVTASPLLLQAQGLSLRDALGVPRLREVSLALHAGEIVGVAGVSGNGQTELLEVLSGMRRPDAGRLRLLTRISGTAHAAEPAAPRIDSIDFQAPQRWLRPAQARQRRIAHVPEDRHRRGLVLPFAAWESAVLGYHRLPRFALPGWGWMRRRAMRAATQQMMEAYDVRPRDVGLKSANFSGGNQQKLVLAREAMASAAPPQVLLVGQPTRGVDIGAIEFIHGRLRALREAGGAVLLVSSELDEILALADRVLVMEGGRIAGELPIARCTETALGRLMAGAQAPQHAA